MCSSDLDDRFSAFVVNGAMVDPDYGSMFEVTTRIRFGDEEARTVTFGRGDNCDAMGHAPVGCAA